MPASAVHSILLKKENAHDDPIYCCAWTKTNTTGDSKAKSTDFLVTGGLDSLVKVWKLENNKLELVHTLKGHSMAVVSVAVSPDEFTLASTSLDCSLLIWDMIAGQKVHEIQAGPTDVWKVTFSPDGTQVVSGSHTGKLNIYSVEKGVLERTLDTRGKFALSVAWSANGKYIASGSVDGTVCIFDVTQGKLLHTIEAHTKLVRSITFSPKCRSVITASDDGNVKSFDVASAGHQSTLEHKSWAVGVCSSPDGIRIATASADGSVRVALADGLKILHTFTEHTDTFASLFCVVAAAAAVVIPSPVAVQQVAAPITKVVYEEHEAPAQYEYEYSINDPQTGDIKSSKENRNGDDVHGYYSLVQPDGLQRIVEYTSSKEHGFNAVVRYEGQAKVAAPAPVAYAAAPVAKLAYAPASVGKVAYQAPIAYAPAPVAKVAYAQTPVVYKSAQVAYTAPAPVAKVAYAQAPAQVTYAQPAQVTYSQPAQVSYAQAPAQVAYAHQPAQVQYTAPAPVAYAQPLTKVAYSPAASVGHVTYASPSASYSH